MEDKECLNKNEKNVYVHILYLTWTNQPREEYGGEGREVLPRKS